MMDKVKKEKAELIERRDKLQDEVAVMKEFDVMRPYKLNEIADIEKEMKAITFKELVEKDQDCPEGLKPSDAEGKSYMKKFLEAKDKEVYDSKKEKENQESNRTRQIASQDPEFRVERFERKQNAERESGINGVKAGGIIPAVVKSE